MENGKSKREIATERNKKREKKGEAAQEIRIRERKKKERVEI